MRKEDLIKYLNMGGGHNLHFFQEEANDKIEEFCKTVLVVKEIDTQLCTGNHWTKENKRKQFQFIYGTDLLQQFRDMGGVFKHEIEEAEEAALEVADTNEVSTPVLQEKKESPVREHV